MDIIEQDEETMSLEDFLEKCKNDSLMISHSSKLLLSMIEEKGKREVVENGEILERYKIFDNPSEDGEHAVIGHTKQLNKLVKKIRSIALPYTNDYQMMTIMGPTGAGKSEIRRCIISELQNFVEEKGVWTIQVKVDGKWVTSPLRINPVTVVNTEERESIINESNATMSGLDSRIIHSVDPVTRKYLEDIDNIEEEVRVIKRDFSLGDGIGMVQSEDEAPSMQKMSGKWVKERIDDGDRDPEGFSFEGFLSQGSNGISFIEDGMHHLKLISDIIDFVDDGEIKISMDTWIDIDTVLFIIGRETLVESLEDNFDDFESIERRLVRFDIEYLSDYKLEEKLHWKMLKKETNKFSGQKMNLKTYIGDEMFEKEVAPHGLEIVSMFNITTRLDSPNIDDLINISEGSLKKEKLDSGVSPTFSRDIIASMISQGQNSEVIMPERLLKKLKEETKNNYSQEYKACKNHLYKIQEKEFLEAVMDGNMVTEENFLDYLEHVFKASIIGKGGEENSHEIMKEYEIHHLGFFDEDDYGDEPDEISDELKKFRRDTLADPLSKSIKGRDFDRNQVKPRKINFYEEVVGGPTWKDFKRVHTGLDIEEFQKEKPLGEKNKELKEKTVSFLIDEYRYSEDSAKKLVKKIIGDNKDRWENARAVQY